MPGPGQRKKADSHKDPELKNRLLAIRKADLAVRADLGRHASGLRAVAAENRLAVGYRPGDLQTDARKANERQEQVQR